MVITHFGWSDFEKPKQSYWEVATGLEANARLDLSKYPNGPADDGGFVACGWWCFWLPARAWILDDTSGLCGYSARFKGAHEALAARPS